MIYSAFVDCICSLFKSEPQDAPLTDDQRRRKGRQDVENMLAYAVKQPNINVQPDLLQHTVPLLCRKFGELTEEDHVRLWDSYNNLSILIRPVTAESIANVEQFNPKIQSPKLTRLWVSALLILLLVFVCQAYSTLLLNGLKDYSKLEGAYNKVLDDEKLAAGGAIEAATKNGSIASIINKKISLENDLWFSAKNQCKVQDIVVVSSPFSRVIRESDFCNKNYPFTATAGEEPQSSAKIVVPVTPVESSIIMPNPAVEGEAGMQLAPNVTAQDIKNPTESKPEAPSGPADANNKTLDTAENIKHANATANGCLITKTNPPQCPPFDSKIRDVFNTGKAISGVLDGLIMPVLLGVLGAIAFVIRRTLDQIADTTYINTGWSKTIMRVMLGGLLGFLGPYLYTSGNVEEMGLGLSLFSFLMGYSVEMAFSILDRFIAFLRESVKPQPQQVASSPMTTPPPLALGNGAAGTAQGSPDVGNVADARQQLAGIRRQLRESLTLTPILEKVLPPELFEQMVKPKSEAANALLTQLGSESAAGTDTAVMALAMQASDKGKGLVDGNHPLVLLLSGALGSFDEAAKDQGIPLDTAKFVQSIFSGSVAAFKQGTGTYERWSAFLLGQPHVARFTAGLQASAEAGNKTLSLCGIFKRVFASPSDALSKELMTFGLSDTPTDQLACALWSGERKLENLQESLAKYFANQDEFEEGWADYRRCLLRQILLQQDFPQDVFMGFEGSTLPVSETLAAVEALRENRISAKDLDILSLLSDELMKASQANTEMDVIGMIQRLLPFAQTKQSRTSQDDEA